MRESTFQVRQIHCGSCEMTISTLLGEVEGVAAVTPDQRTNRVTITFDESRVDEPRLEDELAAAGFPVVD